MSAGYKRCKYVRTATLVVLTEIVGHNVSTFWFSLHKDGLLLVYPGYGWDGASGFFDISSIIEASCAHDVLCEMINSGMLPKSLQDDADETFRKIAKDEGMPKWLQIVTYLAVRWYQLTK